MMERLGRHLRPHPEKDGKRTSPAKGLRWYHKAFLVPVFTLAVFSAASVAIPDGAQAHEGEYDHWLGNPQPYPYSACWYPHIHLSVLGGTDFYLPRAGCYEWNDTYGVYVYKAVDRYGTISKDSTWYWWNGYQWIYWIG